MSVLSLPHPEQQSLSVRAKAVVFQDPRSRALLDRIHLLAPSDATILISGETGTGKEIVARRIHELSTRASGPFVAVNCGAFAETLVESELFGHDKGAFTGANVAKAGWFEAADHGTLFLDEIGDLPPPVQVKLLRVLQEREVVRVGSRRPVKIDVRLIAATNVDLRAAVAAGRFRKDLYYRLDVARIALPALRERPGDIVPLAEHFLDVHGRRLGGPKLTLTTGAIERLLDHEWPGNIRELENVIHNAALTAKSGVITADDVHVADDAARDDDAPAPDQPPPDWGADVIGPTAALERALLALYEREPANLYELIEQTVMRSAFAHAGHNQLRTARLLGISRNVVRARLVQYGAIAGPLRRTAR